MTDQEELRFRAALAIASNAKADPSLALASVMTPNTRAESWNWCIRVWALTDMLLQTGGLTPTSDRLAKEPCLSGCHPKEDLSHE